MSLLVSAIMPSKRSADVVSVAIGSFQAQTYQSKSLVILRDHRQVADDTHAIERIVDVRDLYCSLRIAPPGVSIGEMRNMLCRIALGSVLAHADDDDVSAPDRLERSMLHINNGADLVGSSRAIFVDPVSGKRWLFDGSAFEPKYILGGTFVYRRKLWEKIGFRDVTQGEDTHFYYKAHYGGANIVDLADENLYTATLSPDSTSPKDTNGPGWTLLGGGE